MSIFLIVYTLLVGGLYRTSFGPFKYLNIFHLFFFSYVIAILVALPSLAVDEKYFQKYFYAAITTPVIFWFGAVLGKIKIFPTINNSYRYIRFNEYLKKHNNLLMFMFFGLILLYLLDVGLKNSGLLFALNSPSDSIAAMEIRMRALTSNISPILTRVYGYSRAFLIPFLACIFLVYWLEGNIKFKKLLVVIFVSIFYMAYSAAKAPVFYLILALALTYYWWQLNKNPKAAYKYAAYFSTIMFSGLFISALFYPLLNGIEGEAAIQYAWEQMFRRVFEVPSSVAMNYFEVFGRSIDYIGLKNNIFISIISGEERISSAQFLFAFNNPNHHFADSGLINAAFFSALYGEFGFLWMVLGVLCSGFVSSQVNSYINSLPRNAISISCQAICALGIMQLSLTHFTSILIGRGFLLLPVLLCLTIYVKRLVSNKI